MKATPGEFLHILSGHLYAAKMMLRRRELLIFLVIQVLIQTIISIGATFNNLYFIDKRGIGVPAEALAVIPLFSGLTVIATSFLIVPFITPASVIGFLILGTTLLSVQIYLFLLAPVGSVAVLIGAAMTGSFGWALFNPALSGTWANLISDRDRPRLVAFSNVVVFGLAMIGPLAGGVLYDEVHPSAPLVLNLCLYGALMACIIWAALHGLRPRRA
jgi:MFS family permease